MSEPKRLTVLFVRPSNGATMHRALASLEGAADEAVKLTNVPDDTAAFTRACQMLSIEPVVSTQLISTVTDQAPNFLGMIPETLCKNGRLALDLSQAVNVAMEKEVTGTYVLLMSPSEVCLDPLNIARTLDYLDTKPQISAVSCPTKIYEAGEHVRTIMEPKIIRRDSVKMTGLFADNWFPCNDLNWLINASGLEFLDHGDTDVNQELVDAKLCVYDYISRQEVATRDERVTLAARLIPWNPRQALLILAKATSEFLVGSTESVRMLITAARANIHLHSYYDAIEQATSAIQILPSPMAYLLRGLARCGIESGWEADLRKATELAQATTIYGLDLRELNLAKLLVRWMDEVATRCSSNHGNGIDVPCLVAIGHEGKHIGIHEGLRVTWDYQDYCLDCGAPIDDSGHGDCQNT